MTITEIPPSILTSFKNKQFGHNCNVEAHGTLRVFLTMNVGSSLFPDGPVDQTGATMYDTFRRLRGSDEFVTAVRKLPDRVIKEGSQFLLDTEIMRIERVGYQMGVLSQYLRDYEFTPIYVLDPNPDINPIPKVKFDEELEKHLTELGIRDVIVAAANARLAEEWNKWPVKKVMLSRYGVFQVILERPLPYKPPNESSTSNLDETVPITDILELVLGLDQNFDVQTLLDQAIQSVSQQTTRSDILAALRKAEQLIEHEGTIRSAFESSIDPSVQWEVVREIRSRFLDAFGRELVIHEKDGTKVHPIVLSFTGSDKVVPAFTHGVSYNLRFRYVIFDFDRLKWNGEVVHEPTLSLDMQADLAALLEAVLLTRTPSIPRTTLKPSWLANIKKERIQKLFERDVSTWDWEYCLFSADNALICHYYPTIAADGREIALKLAFLQEVYYPDYWASIVRGIAYLAELHTVAEYLELDTSDDLEDTSRLMLKVHLGSLRSVQPTITNIINKVAHSSRLVARLRNASMSTTMATADYALIKYKELSHVFEMETTLHHSDRNINLINSHLAHYDDVLMQSDVRRSSILTVVLTVALIFLTTALAWFSFPTFVGEIKKPSSESAALINTYMSWLILNPASIFARIGGVILILMTASTIVAFILASFAIPRLNSHRLHITRTARRKMPYEDLWSYLSRKAQDYFYRR